MTLYESIRHFADSHWLAIMFILFAVLCAWPFRPGSRAQNRTAAMSIFEEADDGQ
ncbi:cbb3-type cytochrome oxidase subunit 3 [Altererythrobacter sp.]|uniref:cbb3-type cytochrome oxidase subunit 3 n=1 Tax=Altererythrobacter sp. TaxID=1872480 RepID=UPI003CFBE0D9